MLNPANCLLQTSFSVLCWCVSLWECKLQEGYISLHNTSPPTMKATGCEIVILGYTEIVILGVILRLLYWDCYTGLYWVILRFLYWVWDCYTMKATGCESLGVWNFLLERGADKPEKGGWCRNGGLPLF